MERRIENRQLAHILTLFLIVQFGGIFIASLLFTTSQVSLVSSSSVISSPIGVLWYALYIILVAAIMLLIFKFYRGDIIFVLIEAIVVTFASFFVFLIFLSYIAPSFMQNYVYILAFLLAIALVVAKNKMPKLRNLAAVLSSIGVGVVLGISFHFWGAYVLMAIIALYDYIAVFITKHMVTMAKAVSSRNLAFLIGTSDVEVVPNSYFKGKDKKEIYEYKKELSKAKDPTIKKFIKAGKIPLISQMQLGAGDLGIPLMLAIAAYYLFFNYFMSIVVVIGAAFGLVATTHFLRKYQKPLPAIPPIFSFINIALGIGFIFVSISYLKLAIAFIVFGIFIVLTSMVITLKKKV